VASTKPTGNPLDIKSPTGLLILNALQNHSYTEFEHNKYIYGVAASTTEMFALVNESLTTSKIMRVYSSIDGINFSPVGVSHTFNSLSNTNISFYNNRLIYNLTGIESINNINVSTNTNYISSDSGATESKITFSFNNNCKVYTSNSILAIDGTNVFKSIDYGASYTNLGAIDGFSARTGISCLLIGSDIYVFGGTIAFNGKAATDTFKASVDSPLIWSKTSLPTVFTTPCALQNPENIITDGTAYYSTTTTKISKSLDGINWSCKNKTNLVSTVSAIFKGKVFYYQTYNMASPTTGYYITP
jgi:hypothetical protein